MQDRCCSKVAGIQGHLWWDCEGLEEYRWEPEEEVKKIVSSSGTEPWTFSTNIIHISTFTSFSCLPDTGLCMPLLSTFYYTHSICILLSHKVTLVTDERSWRWWSLERVCFTFLKFPFLLNLTCKPARINAVLWQLQNLEYCHKWWVSGRWSKNK